jgi:hypothetical protein
MLLFLITTEAADFHNRYTLNSLAKRQQPGI